MENSSKRRNQSPAPIHAIVLCVDEKPSIQALERKTDNGKIVRTDKSTCKRHGTLNLFAAPAVSTGQIKGKVTETKKREDFLEFMAELVADYLADQQIHVILDNYSTMLKGNLKFGSYCRKLSFR